MMTGSGQFEGSSERYEFKLEVFRPCYSYSWY